MRTGFNIPKYPGKNKFIKKLIKLTQFEYLPLEDGDFINLILCGSKNYFARAGGIKLCEKSENIIQLYLISVPSTFRNQGVGSTIINCLTHTADETGFTIVLTPSNVFTSMSINSHRDYVGNIGSERKNKIKVSDLSKWYSKFGFVFDGKDEDGKKQMKYTPPEPTE